MTVLLVIIATVCVAALLPLGLLAYFGNARLVVVPVAVLFGALVFGVTGALLGLPVDILLETAPTFSAIGGAAGVIVGIILGLFGGLRRRS